MDTLDDRRLFPNECWVIVDGYVMDRVSGPTDADSSMTSCLRGVWNAWTSCEVWAFEDQKLWAEHSVQVHAEDMARLRARLGE